MSKLLLEVLVTESKQLVYTLIHLHLFTRQSKYWQQFQQVYTLKLHYQFLLVKSWIQETCFFDIWCIFLTSVQYNLEHGLANVIESFSLLNLNYITSSVKVQIRSDMTSHAISDTVYVPCALNWPKLVCAGSN